MVAFWETMRSICPKVNIYHGPILIKEGECTTDKDLDLAMLATKEFWFEPPPGADQAWDPAVSLGWIFPSHLTVLSTLLFCIQKIQHLVLMVSRIQRGGYCLM